MKMSRLLAACAQIECRPGDLEANLQMHLDAISDARRRDVRLLVFPELSLTDYLSDPDTAGLARSADSTEILKIADAAGEMSVSFGFIERGGDGLFYNSQAMVRASRLTHIHRKLNLPTYGKLCEGHYYTAGSGLTLAPVDENTRAATLICADSWNPALAWIAALNAPDLLIHPTASARGAVDGDFDNPTGWDINLRHNAMTYGLPIIMVNHCGKRGNLNFWGGSRMLDGAGRELVRADEAPTLVTAELDFDHAAAARANLPTIRDANTELIRAELNRLLQSSFGS